MQEITLRPGDELCKLVDRVAGYAADAKAPATHQAYDSDWRSFERWCGERGLVALPATDAIVCLYITSLADAGKAVATIGRAVCGIAHHHRHAGFEFEVRGPVAEVLAGIRRRLGCAQRRKAAIEVADLATIIATCGDDLIGIRDRALLLLGWTGAFRRSEIVGFDVSDLRFTRDGCIVTIRKSKADQEGRGREVATPFARNPAMCATLAVQQWLSVAGIENGPVFRAVSRHGHVGVKALSGRAVSIVLKRAADSAGLDPDALGAHSLRAGLVTAAARAGKSIPSMQRQSGHVSVGMLMRYVRVGQLFDDNAAAGLL